MFLYRWQRFFSALLFLPALLSISVSFCQTSAANFFIKHGNNLSQVTCGGLLFAPAQNQNHQSYGAGSVWLKQQIDLTKPLDISFVLDFIDTTAVDGGAFVLQSDSAAVGDTYNGLGYRNIKKSVAITFDAEYSVHDNDPPFDHISIQSNGDTKHGTANELATPVSIEPFYSYALSYPLFHHLVTVKWDPALEELSCEIDHARIISTQIDLIQKIFQGNPIVYWGFTASNTQEVYYPASKELTFGYFYFFFGDIFPRYTSNPELDTCFSKPIQFFDASVYAVDSFYNNVQYAKWYWDFGDGQHSNVRFPPPHQYPAAGAYTLKFTVSNHLGCTFDTLVRIIHLGSIPTVDFNIDGLACVNTPITFKDSSVSEVGEPTAFTWTFPGGLISIEKNPTVSIVNAGPATINLRVRTYYGCEAEKTKTIDIGEKPIVDFTYNKDCDGHVLFIPAQLNTANIVNWFWNFGDGSSAIVMQPTHHYKQNNLATASLLVKSIQGCISDSVSRQILINKIYSSAGNDTIISIGQPLQPHASGGEHYEWIPSTGLNNSLIPDPVAILNQDQQYVVQITNNDGCEARDTILVKVYKGPDVYLPDAFTPNNDGRNDVFRPIGPGIQSLQYFRIYNRTGNLIFESRELNKGWDGTFAGQAQPSATYVWMLAATDIHGTKIFRKGTVVLLR